MDSVTEVEVGIRVVMMGLIGSIRCYEKTVDVYEMQLYLKGKHCLPFSKLK